MSPSSKGLNPAIGSPGLPIYSRGGGRYSPLTVDAGGREGGREAARGRRPRRAGSEPKPLQQARRCLQGTENSWAGEGPCRGRGVPPGGGLAPLPAHAEEPAHVLAHRFCLSSASICRSSFLMLMSMLCSLLFVFFKTRQFCITSENTSVLFFFLNPQMRFIPSFTGLCFLMMKFK